MDNKWSKVAAIAAVGIFILLLVGEMRRDEQSSLGNSVNEVVEEVKDEIDDNTTSK